MAAPAFRPSVQHSHLAALQHTLDRLRADVADLRDRLSDAELAWRPSPASWSIAECYLHLALTTEAYLPRLRAAVDEAQPDPACTPYRPTWTGRLMIWGVQPGRFRMPTFPALDPREEDGQGRAPQKAFDRFITAQDQLAELLQRADGCNLHAPKLASPFSRLIRLSPGDAFAFLLAHEKRHAEQARQIRDIYLGIKAPGRSS